MILIFSIAMGADYSFFVKSIATFALNVMGTYIISVLASVHSFQTKRLIAKSIVSMHFLPNVDMIRPA